MKTPTGNTAETAALNELLGILNNPELQGKPKIEEEQPKDLSPDIAKFRAAQKALTVDKTPNTRTAAPSETGEAAQNRAMQAEIENLKAAVVKFVPAEQPSSKDQAWIKPAAAPSKLFFTGRLKAGKDNAATAAGATIFGFADPMYAVASHFFGVEVSGTKGKDLPGAREFLQAVGQFGRGTINEKYPLTVSRANFISLIRAAGKSIGSVEDLQVDWDSFGRDPDIWLKACVARANVFLEENPTARVAITNCRFDNEFRRLQAEGWTHFHVMASPATWVQRLAESKLTPESPAVKDVSEQLAMRLDASVIKQLSEHRDGPRLRAIWSDSVPAPSPRLHTVESFLKSIGGAA